MGRDPFGGDRRRHAGVPGYPPHAADDPAFCDGSQSAGGYVRQYREEQGSRRLRRRVPRGRAGDGPEK